MPANLPSPSCAAAPEKPSAGAGDSATSLLAAKLGHRSLDAGHRGAAALVLRIGNAGEVERRLGGGVGEIERFQSACAIDAQQREIVLLVLGDAIGIAMARNRDRDAAVGDLAVGNDRAVVTDDDAGAVFHGLARRRPGHLHGRRKRIERARHRDHDRLHGILGGLVVEDGEDADLVAPEGAAEIKFLQALQAGQHEEVRLDHGVVDVAPRLFLLALGELCGNGAGFLAPGELNLDRAGRRRPFGAVGVAGLLRHQFGRNPEPHAGAGIGDDLPADAFLLFPGGIGKDAALLRIEHAGLLGPAGFLEFLDRIDHALADVARDGAVVLPDPGEIRLQRQPLGLPQCLGRVLRLLQRGADRHRCHRFRVGAGRGGGRHLRPCVRGGQT